MQKDLIGRDEIVNNVCALIRNLSKDEHFCLALNGEWGSGKSFVIDMLEEKLKTNEEYFIVKYDAWENSFYSDPLIAILYCILDGLQENLYYIRGAKEYGAAAKVIVKNVGKVASDIAKAVDPTNKIEKVFNVISSISNGIKNSIKALKFDKTDNETFKEFKSYKSLLNEVKETLNKLTSFEINNGKQTKLIILVDEIDRCLPNEQLKVLERLHHLLDVKNCFVVCSLNKKSMEQCFKHSFDNNGDDYLKKFFDKEIYLKSLSESYLDNLLTIKIDEIAEIKNIPISTKQKTQLAKFLKCVLDNNCKILGNNLTDNREITRILNSIVKTVSNVAEVTKFEQIAAIIILIYIKSFVRTLYEKDFIRTDTLYKLPVDFIRDYIPGKDSDFSNGSIHLFEGRLYNQYYYSFLKYYNMTLNYYKFDVQVDDFYKTFESFKRDEFIQNFADILKKIEIYGK